MALYRELSLRIYSQLDLHPGTQASELRYLVHLQMWCRNDPLQMVSRVCRELWFGLPWKGRRGTQFLRVYIQDSGQRCYIHYDQWCKNGQLHEGYRPAINQQDLLRAVGVRELYVSLIYRPTSLERVILQTPVLL
jgi:hypothetical protein